MTAGRCARTIRAAVFAAVCVVLAALGHVMMSGDHVPLRTLLAGWAVTGVAGWCLAGRERGLRLVVAVAVAVQTALHSAFSLAPAAPDSMDMGSAESMPMPMHMSASMSAHMGHAGTPPTVTRPSACSPPTCSPPCCAACGWGTGSGPSSVSCVPWAAGWPRRCGSCSRCPHRRPRPCAHGGGPRTGRRASSCSSTRSPLEGHPWGPLPSDGSR
ncbi:hypothetical protein [Streptomyces afghaniensis 772] [Streptomyces afghaniensis]